MTLLFAISLLANPQSPGISDEVAAKWKGQTIAAFTMKDIDGKPVKLQSYLGKVLLIVNVASKCGYTPQYDGLQKLHEKFGRQGFAVLGFPANEFRGQEPGTNAEIKDFCAKEYGVTFPMFAKIVVKGAEIDPLYQWLLASTDPKRDVEWNFCKFLVNREGKVLGRYVSRVSPADPGMQSDIEKALASP